MHMNHPPRGEKNQMTMMMHIMIRIDWGKSKPKISTLKHLLDETFSKRRTWITGSYPAALEVLDTFPCLENVQS